MWWIIGTVVFAWLFVICLFIIGNLLKQVEILEAEVGKSVEIEERAVSVYEFFLKLYTETLNDLKRIDRNGAFASDDEVGFVFRSIVESIEHVKYQIELLNSNTQKSENDEDVTK